MDLWFVGRVPIGHYQYNFPKDFVAKSSNTAVKGAKVCIFELKRKRRASTLRFCHMTLDSCVIRFLINRCVLHRFLFE